MKKFISDIIIKPLMTEKTASLERVTMLCIRSFSTATKNEIRDSIQKFFDVKVKDVRTSIKPGKKVTKAGRTIGKRSKQKKAFITLKEGSIELIQGV